MISQTKINLPDIIGKGYGDFWRFRGRYRVVKGSRASKKSKTTALNIIVRMMQMPLANTLVVRRTGNTLRDSCWADLQWATYRLGVNHLWSFAVSPLSAEYKPTGQRVFFRGLDDPHKLASISCKVGFICWCWVEEAYEIDSESDFDMVDDTIRGALPDGYFKQITLTFNPWSPSFWGKRRFFDAPPSPDIFAATTTYRCNEWLDDADLRRFEEMQKRNPKRFAVAGDGDWGISEGQVFEEWSDLQEHYDDRLGTHVVSPFRVPDSWRIWRSMDWGYSRPFSVHWSAVDHDERIYVIRELYGCTGTPNEGVKWEPTRVASKIKEIEAANENLKGKKIYGVADPAIWASQGTESIASLMEKERVYFERGKNDRLNGLMQMHYRLAFGEDERPMLYVFRTCKHLIRTLPLLVYDETDVEDVDSDGEDHAYDEIRYLCMRHPISPKPRGADTQKPYDPLDSGKDTAYRRYDYYRGI